MNEVGLKFAFCYLWLISAKTAMTLLLTLRLPELRRLTKIFICTAEPCFAHTVLGKKRIVTHPLF